MKKNCLFVTAAMLFATCLVQSSCSDSADDFTTSASSLLTLPADTFSLDTMMTRVASRTYRYTIRNKGNKGVRISRVSLGQGADSPFRVNVDGSYVGSGYNQPIEVRRKDSLQVWVEATLPQVDGASPQPVSDVLTLQLESGATQSITLIAWGQNVVTIEPQTLSNDTLLKSDLPFHVTGSLTVAAGATLRLAPGTKLYLHDGAELNIRGSLVAEGTPDSIITLRGDRMDLMFVGQSYDRVPGRWGGIHIFGSSVGNSLSWCDIHTGDYGIRIDSTQTVTRVLTMQNTVLHNVRGNAFQVTGGQTYVGNSQITNAGGNCVTLFGGNHEFNQCTIGRFYVFEGGQGHALYMYNSSAAGAPLPLTRARFLNCLITGYSDDEIFANFLPNSPVAANYQFDYCLLTTDSVGNDSHFNQVVWDRPSHKVWGDGNFKKFDLDHLVFNFELDSLSPAIGKGSYETVSAYPVDLSGKVRPGSRGVSIGAYEIP